jgi:superoxide dismutase, Cu-Zn family
MVSFPLEPTQQVHQTRKRKKTDELSGVLLGSRIISGKTVSSLTRRSGRFLRGKKMKRQLLLGTLGALVLIVVTSVMTLTSPGDLIARGDEDPRAQLQDVKGNPVGAVRLSQGVEDQVGVLAKVHDLPPGFHGFHVHEVGQCEPPFTSAGGHLNLEDAFHPEHSGDMPVLLVNSDGTGEVSFETDRFALKDLFDEDGSAIIIHALPDNYANIPERYGEVDQETLQTGDSGDRIACGAIQKR